MRRLEGQTAIVTGGGRGLGRATALALAAEGANVVVTARTAGEVEETARMVDSTGAGALALAGDAAVEADVDRVVRAALSEFGAVHVLINNAGFAISAPTYKTEIADWDRVIAVNLRGAFLYSRAVAPQMIARRHGVIIGISSAAGLRGAPVHGLGAYAASKFGLTGFMESLAESLREFGVRAFTICPGPVHDAGSNLAEKLKRPRNPRSVLSVDVANAILFAVTSLPLATSGRAIDLYQPTF